VDDTINGYANVYSKFYTNGQAIPSMLKHPHYSLTEPYTYTKAGKIKEQGTKIVILLTVKLKLKIFCRGRKSQLFNLCSLIFNL